MNPTFRKFLTVVLVAVNAAIWPFWIIPALITLSAAGPRTAAGSGSHAYRPVTDTRAVRVPINPGIRDPFSFGAGVNTRPVKTTIRDTRPAAQTSSSAPSAGSTVKKYESQFRLRSVVLLGGKYFATLEEMPHYGSGPGTANIRFGSTLPQENRTHVVTEGETVLGETVSRIRENSVTLTRDGQSVQLSFTGDQ